MTNATHSRRPRWAPWWACLVPVIASNYLRQVIVAPQEVGDLVSVALFAATTVAVVVVVTALYRASSQPLRIPRRGGGHDQKGRGGRPLT